MNRPIKLFHADVILASLLVLLTSSRALADYPIMSHRYLADPGSLVYGGRVYLYNSNDDDNAEGGGYTMHSIVCVSTADLKNWTDHGIVFQVPANASWAQNSWAPQPIERDDKIFLYFGNSGSGVGVASSTSPTGGFKDAKGGYLVDSSTSGASGTDSWLFDPGAFIDDDGTAYLSFGGNGVNNGRIIKLGSDLASVSGSAVGVSTTSFFEASFLFKRNGIYYFSFSTNPSNGLRIDYLKSSSPMSGYTYGGVIADQPPSNGDNNHASQFEFKGKWYHAHHNRYVATQAGISKTYKRNLALEALEFDTDGTIQQVKYTTDGVPQVGNLDPYARIEAETMNAQNGIETETCSEGGMNVTQIGNGDWIRVRGVDFGSSGAATFSARVASATSGGTIELRVGSATGTLIGTCAVPATGGAQTWATTTCDVTGATGVKDLCFKFTASGSQSFKFDYWQFTAVNGGTGGAGGTGSGGGTATSGGTGATGGASGSGDATTGGGRSASGGSTSSGGSRSSGTARVSSTGGAIAATKGSASGGGAPSTSGSKIATDGGSDPVGGNDPGDKFGTSQGGATVGTATSSASLGTGSGTDTGKRTSTGTGTNAGGTSSPSATVSPEGSSGSGTCGCRIVGGAPKSSYRSLAALCGVLLLRSLQRRTRSQSGRESIRSSSTSNVSFRRAR